MEGEKKKKVLCHTKIHKSCPGDTIPGAKGKCFFSGVELYRRNSAGQKPGKSNRNEEYLQLSMRFIVTTTVERNRICFECYVPVTMTLLGKVHVRTVCRTRWFL